MRSWPSTAVPLLPEGPQPVLQLHDTSAGVAVPVTPAGTARLYVCGITPYDATHLGHAATYLAFDTLVRLWRDRGLDVLYAQNVTDIDDPLLERATRDGLDWAGLAERETALFREDMHALRVLPPTWYVGAVEAMEEIAAAVGQLLDAGVAYRVEDDVYCANAAGAHFGKVSRLDEASMLALSAERGGDPDRPGKKDPLDARLWQAARPGEPSWDSPLGPGRPGWHVECASIALNRLGPVLDVVGGGSDLAFPHHEHSAAESSLLSGRWPVATAFVHAGMVGLDGEKMSKSRGNLVFVSRLRADGVDLSALRLALLSAHYRADREWDDATFGAGEERLRTWRGAVARAGGPPADPVLRQVRSALADDLDTPRALAVVDAWCAAEGDDPSAPALVSDVVDALLGVALATSA